MLKDIQRDKFQTKVCVIHWRETNQIFISKNYLRALQTFALCIFSACYHPEFREEEQISTPTTSETGEFATKLSETASSGEVTPECGNEVVEAGEECDAGASNANEGACTQTCKQAQCGDGFLWSGMENCDPGIAYANQNINHAYHVCNAETCSWQDGFCGDGLLQEEEICDPSITYLNQSEVTNYHVCAPNTCTWLGGWCGDGKKEGFEECDEGTGNADHAGCTLACNKASCGDGLIWEGVEQCELGIDYPGADEESGYNVCTPYLCEWKGGSCGDGVVQEKFEECDDGNELDNDGCESDCTRTLQTLVTGHHTCALWKNGRVRCWGSNSNGKLGYGNKEDIGDNEFPFTAGDIQIGGSVVQLAAGWDHTCVLLEEGKVRCWGDGTYGQLGYGNQEDIGDDEHPFSVGDVPVGGQVVQLAAGIAHTCVLLVGGQVRCWGNGEDGRLGYKNVNSIGDDEHPSVAGNVNVGGLAIQISAGGSHTCALFEGGKIRCWGHGYYGDLGYGNKNNIGDDEYPELAGDVPVGSMATQISTGKHTCALLQTGKIRCWGYGWHGELGYGNQDWIGDDETPESVGDVPVGSLVSQIAAGFSHTCVLLTEGQVRCWGRGQYGQLGYGNAYWIGDDEPAFTAGDVPVGGKVAQITTGSTHTCALLAEGQVRCWGTNSNGELGYGNTEWIGDDETPASAGDVPLFDVP